MEPLKVLTSSPKGNTLLKSSDTLSLGNSFMVPLGPSALTTRTPSSALSQTEGSGGRKSTWRCPVGNVWVVLLFL